jgi:hypothetical protein
MLDDIAGAGSSPSIFPPRIIKVGQHMAIFKSRSHIALNDSVRLLAPYGSLVDRLSYLRIKGANLSYGRLPDGNGTLRNGLWPTPLQPNQLFIELPAEGGPPKLAPPCPAGGYPQAIPPRARQTRRSSAGCGRWGSSCAPERQYLPFRRRRVM